MNKEQNHSPKYWVVHNKQNDDILVNTLSKNKNWAIERFFNNYTYDMKGVMSDDELEEWWENQTEFVCSLVEIKLVEI